MWTEQESNLRCFSVGDLQSLALATRPSVHADGKGVEPLLVFRPTLVFETSRLPVSVTIHAECEGFEPSSVFRPTLGFQPSHLPISVTLHNF